MDHKLFGIFSGRQLTAVICLAILAPSALIAIPAFTNVAIIDPNSGYRANVDTKGQVFTFDTLSAYANDPSRSVDIGYSASADGCGFAYTIPDDRALVIRAITGYVAPRTTGAADLAGFRLTTDSACATQELAGFQTGASAGAAPVQLSFGAGISLAAGTTFYYSLNNITAARLHMHGYLVPASAVPTPGATAQAGSGTSKR